MTDFRFSFFFSFFLSFFLSFCLSFFLSFFSLDRLIPFEGGATLEGEEEEVDFCWCRDEGELVRDKEEEEEVVAGE